MKDETPNVIDLSQVSDPVRPPRRKPPTGFHWYLLLPGSDVLDRTGTLMRTERARWVALPKDDVGPVSLDDEAAIEEDG